MAEYIDRETAINAVVKNDCEGYASWAIKSVPTADVVERKHGKWKDVLFGWECSVCHVKQEYSVFFDFCPNCGADMRAEEGE